jgi:2-dehydropantoate 2-reductase
MQTHAHLKIVFLGIGAIGGTAAAWLSAHHPNTYLLARGETAEALRTHGLTLYPAGAPENKQRFPVQTIRDLAEVPDADVVVLGVKLYQLEEAARQVHAQLGDRALVVGLQNGVAGEVILPRYFSRVIYGVVCYNAWVDAPGLIGYQNQGPILLGTAANELQAEVQQLAALFSLGFAAQVTHRLRDAALCKLVVNLGNSVTTLLGLNYRPIDDLDLFQKIIAGTLYEGAQVVRAAGAREIRLGPIPTWRTLWAAAHLPQALTRGLFRRNLSQMTITSMGQDVLQRKKTDTELEYLNGYLVSLADQVHHPAPYNRTVYRLCRAAFSRPGFEPLSARLVWDEIRRAQVTPPAEKPA